VLQVAAKVRQPAIAWDIGLSLDELFLTVDIKTRTSYYFL